MSIIISADIGGTNCRLGLFSLEDGKLKLERTLWLATTDIRHTEAFLARLEEEYAISDTPPACVVAAIAGPVQANIYGQLSNGSLKLDFRGLYDNSNTGTRFWIINDFMAQAYAVMSPEGTQATHICGPKKHKGGGVRAVIGAGTGLGYACIVPTSPPSDEGGPEDAWLALASENGHAAFPFLGKEEAAFHDFLRKKLNVPHATGDDVLSGRGLALLHEFISGEALTPPEVGNNHLVTETETLVWFSRFYGRACRNWILATLASAGLWIAGGIAAQNPLCVRNQYFYDELYGNPRWRDYLETVPVRIIEDKNSGLWGSARFGQKALDSTIINFN